MKQGVIVHEAPAEFANLGPLPVRVRTATGEVVGTGVTGAPIEVPMGSYYVTVQMPDGREIGTDRKVRCVAPGSVVEPPAPPPPLMAAPMAALHESAPPSSPELALDAKIWRGDWLGELARGISAQDEMVTASLPLSTHTPHIITQEDGHDRLLILALPDRYRCTIVPYDGCIVDLDGEGAERAIAARLADSIEGPVIDYRSIVCEQTNGLLGFVESGILTNMVTVTEDQVRRGEMANERGASLLRAITGAYILLRANSLDGVEDWLERLNPFAANLPDIWPLRLELHARQGDHVRAVQDLITCIETGRCPWFRAGLSYMLERLRLYIDVSENRDAPFSLNRGDYLSFRAARDGLERLLPMMMTSRYIATFDLPLAKANA